MEEACKSSEDKTTAYNVAKFVRCAHLKRSKSGYVALVPYNIRLTLGVQNSASRKHAYIILTPLNPTFI